MWKASEYLPENLPETIALAQEYYGNSWVSNPDFLHWQYELNPAGPAIIQLARNAETQELAGQYIVIPMRFKADEQTALGTLSLNTLTREAYTGQGIFTGLAEKVYQKCSQSGIDFCYGFPNPNSYPGFTRKLKFTDLGSIPLLLRPLNLKALVKEKISPLLAPLVFPFQPFFRLNPSPLNLDYEIYPLSASNLSELDVFWHKIQTKYPIMLIRDSAYMRWRYFDIPLRTYRLYGVRSRRSDSEGLLGYIVGRCTEVAGITCGMIVDFLVDSSHQAAGKCLIRTLLDFFVQNEISLAGSLMLPHTEESYLLKAEGFFACPKALEPQPFPVIYRRFQASSDSEKNPFLRLDNWFLTMSDYDVI